jgi:hypothetical protein
MRTRPARASPTVRPQPLPRAFYRLRPRLLLVPPRSLPARRAGRPGAVPRCCPARRRSPCCLARPPLVPWMPCGLPQGAARRRLACCAPHPPAGPRRRTCAAAAGVAARHAGGKKARSGRTTSLPHFPRDAALRCSRCSGARLPPRALLGPVAESTTLPRVRRAAAPCEPPSGPRSAGPLVNVQARTLSMERFNAAQTAAKASGTSMMTAAAASSTQSCSSP